MKRIQEHLKLCLYSYKHWDYFKGNTQGYYYLQIMTNDGEMLKFVTKDQLWEHIERTKANISRKYLK